MSGKVLKSAGTTFGRQLARLWQDESGSAVGGIGGVAMAITLSSYAFSGASVYSVVNLYKTAFHRFFDLIEPALRPFH